MSTGWESGDPGVRSHDDLVAKLSNGAPARQRPADDDPNRYPLALTVRCDGKGGRCREAVAWVGRTADDGLLVQYRSTSAVGDREVTLEAWLDSDVFTGRRPTGLGFDLLEYPGADRRPPVEAACPEGHGPWTLDRGRLLAAARGRLAETAIPAVRSASG